MATFAIVLFEPTSFFVLTLRFLAPLYGRCVSGGHGDCINLAEGDLGLLIGLLVGGLTLGSAAPHLAAAYSVPDWRTPCIAAAIRTWPGTYSFFTHTLSLALSGARVRAALLYRTTPSLGTRPGSLVLREDTYRKARLIHRLTERYVCRVRTHCLNVKRTKT